MILVSRDRQVRYEPTPDDRLWLLRAVEAEGEPRDLVAQTLVNGFLWARAALGSKRTLAQWVRAYAQPVNPAWFRTGLRFQQRLEFANESEREPLRQAALRREFVHSARTTFEPSTVAAVERALSGSPVLSEATDYAAPWVTKPEPWLAHGPAIDRQNRFWTRPGALGWPGYEVEKKKTWGGLMSTIAERLNNAIVALEWNAARDKRVSDGVKRSIVQLGEHWEAFFTSARRGLMPTPLTQGTLERYAQWYARAWLLLPTELRSKLADPRKLDASMTAAIDDTMRAALDSYASAGQAAKALSSDVASVAIAATERVRKDVLAVGVLLIAGFVAYGWARRARA